MISFGGNILSDVITYNINDIYVFIFSYHNWLVINVHKRAEFSYKTVFIPTRPLATVAIKDYISIQG